MTTSGKDLRGEKMLSSGTDPESCITECTLVYDDINHVRKAVCRLRPLHEGVQACRLVRLFEHRMLDIRLPEKGNSNSHGNRPVY